MKSILITASVVGAAVAGIILYYTRSRRDVRPSADKMLAGKVDEEERSMKFSMG